uniref:Uncharacterized protein n=2 Tax=Meloidogyne TaxID=189290 RepID=A0A914KRN8_MELIC
MSNGEKHVIYSSNSAHNLEWSQPEILVNIIHLISINLNKNKTIQQQQHSPIIFVNACKAQNSKPISISNPFAVNPMLLGISSAAYENELIINFKTFENGLLFYSMASHGDHLIVQLSFGRLEIYFDFGANQRNLLIAGLALNDGEWHEMRWLHHFDSVELFVDSILINTTEIGGLYRKLDLNSEIEIGGRNEDFVVEKINGLNLEAGFHGCFARIMLNNVDLLSSAPVELKECKIPQPQLFSLGLSTSLQIPYTFLPFSLDFYIIPNSGPLLTILDNENSSLLQIKIEEKAEEIEQEEEFLPNYLISINTGFDGDKPKIFSIGPPGWHSLVLKLRADSLDLVLNSKTIFWVQGNQARQIGAGMQTFLLSASGCYRSTTIDLNQGILIGNEYKRDECSLIQKCSPNPCMNGGKCIQNNFYTFNCKCSNNYSGRFCQISKLPSSCEQYFALNTSSKIAKRINKQLLMIDLDGGGLLKPFNVECKKINNLKKKGEKSQKEIIEYFTILNNDAPKSGIQVRGISEPGSVRHILNYGLDMDELDNFISSFEHCEQKMSFQCSKDQRLMTYSGEDNKRPSVWYTTRNGQQGLQWGDAPPFSRMCPCALNDSCLLNFKCNCDSGEASLDEGINSHIQLLPILQLFIGGGTSSQSLANVSIGPLECSGRYISETITFTDRNQRLLTSLNFNNARTFYASIQIKLTHSSLTIFTFTSTNQERWFQLSVRDGHLVGQIVNAGLINEIISDIRVDDNKWHLISWEIDEQKQILRVDLKEKILKDFFILPKTSILIVGSRTYIPDRSGFAGQLKHFILNGESIRLGQLAKKVLGNGIQLGEWGACNIKANNNGKCQNEGICVELYDGFKCNCSLTPFAGDTCEEEVGMWLSTGSELRIAWQHPGQVNNCFRINVQTSNINNNGVINLIRANALFAESRFNLSIDKEGHLNAFIFDGFFFTQNVTYDKIRITDNKSKDIRFCANSTGFFLNINGEIAFTLLGNFTFFSSLNVWNFADKQKFKGCISRLMIGNAFPLKNPKESRLLYSGKINFGSCPFDKIEQHKNEQQKINSLNSDDYYNEIHLSSFVKSQKKLLFITPIIGLLSALFILLTLFIFLVYIQRRPDGVYKTNENNSNFLPVPPLIPILSNNYEAAEKNTSKKYNNKETKFAECESLNDAPQPQEFFC